MPEEMELPDSWKTSTGMIDDVDITVMSAEFSFDAGYNNGQSLCLIMQLLPHDGGDTHKQLFSVGDGWEPAKNGMEAVRADGKPKRFNVRSAYGEWYTAAAKLAGGALVDRGETTQAKVWIGTQWHVETEEREFTLRGESQPRKVNRLVPSAFLGIASDETVAVPAATPTQGNGAGGVDAQTKLTLIKLAKANAEYQSFLEAALAEDGVIGNPAAEAVALDEAWWAKTRG